MRASDEMVIHAAPRTPERPYSAKDLAAKRAMAEGTRQYMAILTSPDPKAVAAILALFQANHSQYISNNRAVDTVGLPVAVTGKRLAILRTLYFSPEKELTLSRICQLVHLSPAAATNYVDSLCRGSLVRRSGGPEDGRVNLIQLTSKGQDAFERIASALSSRWTEACTDFTDDEKDLLIRLLKRLTT